MTDRPPLSEKKHATLSRELSELLLEFSIGVHRHAMYPPGHPSLGPAVENIIGRLGEIFEHRRNLSIGVARKQLVIEGVATDSKHPVLSDLARRLHEHQLAAVSFSKGARAKEVEGLLETLARDSERESEPIGLLPEEEIPSWTHIRIFPVGYDQLEMKGDDSAEPDRATQLWLGLAQSALTSEEPVDEDMASDAKMLARIIGEHQREAAYDQVIVGYLLQLAEELRDTSTGETARIRSRVSGLIQELDEDTLARLVEMGGNYGQRKELLLNANHSLAVGSVVKILKAAAEASHQTISTSLTRLLSKLAVHAEEGGGRLGNQADTALRENIEELIADWELEDPNPDQYTALLDQMSRAAPLFAERVEREDPLTGPQRILEMAVEVDAFGPTVEKAVSDLIEQGESRFLLQLVNEVDESREVAGRLRSHLADPVQVRRLLTGEDVDVESLRGLADHMGPAAVEPLLDALAESDSRAIRRKVFDVLADLGPDVARRAVERLEDNRWFVLRNMLALLQRLEIPDDFDPLPFTRHDDHRVRREAFALAVRDERARDRTLATALADEDERLVRMALLEVQGDVSETLLPVMIKRVIKGEHSPEIRALGIRALRGTRSTLARDTLVGICKGGKTLFGKIRLSDASPPVLAALSVLADTWPEAEAAADVLKAARSSKDPEIRASVGEGSGS